MRDDMTVPFSCTLPNGDRLEGRGVKCGSILEVVRLGWKRLCVGFPITVDGGNYLIEMIEPAGESIRISLRFKNTG